MFETKTLYTFFYTSSIHSFKNQRFIESTGKTKLKQLNKGQCDTYKTKIRGDLKRYIKTVHEGKQLFQCNMCDRKVSSKEQLKKHSLLTHSHHCDNCEKKFTIIFDLNNHNASTHSIFKKKPFKCNYCDVTVTLKRHLKRHIEEIHMRTKSFQCEDCDKIFGRKIYFKKHNTLNHPYSCNGCEKKFIKRLHLKNHYLSVHKKAKNDQEPKGLEEPVHTFQCALCDKVLRRKRNLQAHSLLLHQFHCGSCDKKFSMKMHLDEHEEKIHSRMTATSYLRVKDL